MSSVAGLAVGAGPGVDGGEGLPGSLELSTTRAASRPTHRSMPWTPDAAPAPTRPVLAARRRIQVARRESKLGNRRANVRPDLSAAREGSVERCR